MNIIIIINLMKAIYMSVQLLIDQTTSRLTSPQANSGAVETRL